MQEARQHARQALSSASNVLLPMTVFLFLHENARWIAGGFLLTFFSSFGQTFFISLSAGHIRSEYGLSHGEFGGLYMAATLLSALTLPQLGKIVDLTSVSRTVLIAGAGLGVAAVLMAVSAAVPFLFITLYLLRLFGQGMFSHIAFSAMGKWFSASRGRAVSLSAIGVNFGEAIFPSLFVFLSLAVGWRGAWWLAAGTLLVVAVPLIHALMRVERTPQAAPVIAGSKAPREWTRGEALRDPVFYLALTGVLAPGFIGTTVFFHQVYLAELRGWGPEVFARAFIVLSVMTVVFALISGQLIDRFSAVRMLPSFLIPLSASCFVLGLTQGPEGAIAFMALMGISYGFSSTLFGALWPEIYGTKHLGAIRSVIVATLVFSTAMGPGLTGWLIDSGVSYPAQIIAMGVYSLAISVVMLAVSRIVVARQAAETAAD